MAAGKAGPASSSSSSEKKPLNESSDDDDDHTDDGKSEKHENDNSGKYSYLKCGSAAVDNAVVAVQQLGHYEDLVDNFECVVALGMFYVAWTVKAVLLYFFYHYWVVAKKLTFEGELFEGMKKALHNTTLFDGPLGDKNIVMDRFAGKSALMLCSVSRVPSLLHVMVLWVWFGTALNLIGDAMWRFFLVFCFDTSKGANTNYKEKMDPPPGERQIKENIHDCRYRKKLAICVLVVIPDVLLNFLVAIVGAIYISVTSEINFIVKASIKMNFLARMEKIIYPCFVSYNWENFISACQYRVRDMDKLEYPKGMNIGTLVQSLEKFYGTALKAVLGFIFALVFTKIIYGNVGEFRNLCQDYFLKFPEDDILPGTYPLNMAFERPEWHWYPSLR